MTSSWGGPLEFHNIQEIVDIELMFELICMFFCFLSIILITNDQETRKYSKTEKEVNYYYITVP